MREGKQKVEEEEGKEEEGEMWNHLRPRALALERVKDGEGISGARLSQF